MIKSLIAIAVTALFLQGCGGGGGGGGTPSVPPTSPPVTARPTPVEFGFFGTYDNQSSETSQFVSYTFILDWGNWDEHEAFIVERTISQLKDAKAHGINKAVIGIGFLAWTQNFSIKPVSKLTSFRLLLQQEGLLDMVEVLYPIDEPDVAMATRGLTEYNLEAGLRNIQAVFPDKRLMVIYGDTGRGMPAQAFYNIVGKDKYQHGVITVPLMSGQTMALVVGGANPYRDSPDPAVEYALAHPEVEFFVAFIYGQYPDDHGTLQDGIRDNGLLAIFKTAALRLRNGG